MKYRVHLYAEVRVPVLVEANSQVEAVKLAQEEISLYDLFDGLQTTQEQECEYAEEIKDCLVDECGDAEYNNSRRYNIDGVEIA